MGAEEKGTDAACFGASPQLRTHNIFAALYEGAPGEFAHWRYEACHNDWRIFFGPVKDQAKPKKKKIRS